MKERIIGAIVLVAVVVLIVPVFLDGPPAEGEVRSERVPLPGQEDQESRTVVLDRNRTDPVPQAAADAPPEPRPAPRKESAERADKEVVVANQEPETPEEVPAEPKNAGATDSPSEREIPPTDQAASEKAPAPATSSTGMFAVQLGSFSGKENAEQLAADLRKQGFAAFLSQLNTGSASLLRVRVGPQKNRQEAEAMAERLQKAGHDGQVVPHP